MRKSPFPIVDMAHPEGYLLQFAGTISRDPGGSSAATEALAQDVNGGHSNHK